MKKIISILTVMIMLTSALICFASCKNIARKIPTSETFDASGYEEIFFDDFSGDSLDTTRWRYFTGERYGKELNRHIHRGGYYSSDDDIIYVKDSNLYISTKWKKGQYGEGWYSAWIETTTGLKERAYEEQPDNYQGFATKYGYFEIRCIAPPAEGMWSAFWLLPNEGVSLTKNDVQGTAKDGCEVDIMESQNYFRKKPYVQHVLHSDYGTGHGPKTDKSPIFIVPDMYSDYHTYAVEWTPDKFIFYIDGYKTYETENVYDGKVLGTPEVPMSLLLSVEVEGYSDSDGTIHTGIDKKTNKESWLGSMDNMPKDASYDFVIDYVKVMKKKA